MNDTPNPVILVRVREKDSGEFETSLGGEEQTGRKSYICFPWLQFIQSFRMNVISRIGCFLMRFSLPESPG